MYYVLLDFETASHTDLKRCGAWRYAECPTTEVICLAFERQGSAREIWYPGQETQTSLYVLARDPNALFVAHNVAFEKAIWRSIMVPLYGFPDIPNNRWHDTMAACAMRSLPQKLDAAAKVLRLPHQKDMEGSKITLSLSKPDRKTGRVDRSPATIERVGQYCSQDVQAEIDLHERIGWLPAQERRSWLLNERINERGLRIDLDYVRSAQRVVDRGSQPLLAEFVRLTGGLRPGQRDKFLAWLAGREIRLPNLQKETVAEYLGEREDDDYETLADDSDGVRGDHGVLTAERPVGRNDPGYRALYIRSLVESSSVKKLQRMLDCACADGRARGLLAWHGTTPGRPAGRLLQPTNFPRPTVDMGDDVAKQTQIDTLVAAIMTGDPDYVEMVVGPPVETVVSGLRHALVSDRGRCFFSGDYAGIQARLVLALAGQHDKTALMAAGQDVYCDMASAIYGEPITKKDQEKRQTGKNSVLGLGFQMGAAKFLIKYCKHQGLEFAEKVVHTYRKVWAPKVPLLWYALQDAATKCVWDGTPQEAFGIEYRMEDVWLTARVPSGSKIWYPFPEKTRRAMPWDETDIRPGFRYWGQKMGRWIPIHAFGGLLTENVIMRMECDIQTSSALRLEANGFPMVLNVYDENLTEPLEGADEKAFKAILEETDDWVKALRVPIAVDCWQGTRYRK